MQAAVATRWRIPGDSAVMAHRLPAVGVHPDDLTVRQSRAWAVEKARSAGQDGCQVPPPLTLQALPLVGTAVGNAPGASLIGVYGLPPSRPGAGTACRLG
jgi:hypothetical protein